jgi:mRNA interferase MazF
LKTASVIRLSRLAVIDGQLIVGSLGTIRPDRLHAIRQRLARWLAEDPV